MIRSTVVPVILSGGDGTRLWPLSRQKMPKQFIKFPSGESLFQKTLHRLDNIDCETPFIITNIQHQSTISHQLQQINKEGFIILEPFRKDTCAAITLAAIQARKLYSSSKKIKLLILSSDHYIKDDTVFAQLINNISKSEIGLVSIGIKPTSPHTGYGYIQRGKELDEYLTKIEKFHEKPSLDKAHEYIQDGNYLWNSGIFLFDLGIFISELERFSPDILLACEQALEGSCIENNIIKVDPIAFQKSPSISIDYAVMEKTSYGSIAVLDTQWSDIGSWDALAALEKADEDNNVVLGKALAYKTTNSLVYSSGRLVTTLGIDNVAVIETPDAVAVIHKDYFQENKNVVNDLNNKSYSEVIESSKVIYSWGEEEYIEKNNKYCIKKIFIYPNRSIHIDSGHFTIINGKLEACSPKKLNKFLLKGTFISVNKDDYNLFINRSNEISELIYIKSERL
ncbi:mannose-1-phosphate guanylyltransferase/mannose-6-phosphate isomerase [Actinobacillus pleuropneumoniae]|uniref:mannose-1-phosphate guanylyltransferase/mannose-6-phosphate isomerase n=1 Tax=Actinobacillus pleuropneumoniae TaxID=715 RepID=UPI0001E49DDC|nr:mannose-1-phosphate guanylyltransferase/mannose-6-phosphate isomerase [Actinobacillus pleuropneumoniae]EFM95758.1 GDP-mannose pyrophosphorylase [Actinobacillus pleuropneumoniae serovar 10 str. D13039]UKH33438.1 mannose-1-phosphate guanylyltransferase/mannose-6-phosphate isomerase [Actinobacillus pleuropneumoniae serovar 10 str. D13039]